jgi:hypothetical protein
MENPKSWPRLREGIDISGDNKAAFYVRGDDGKYYDFAVDLGLATLQSVTRGISIADIEGDGDIDYVFANQYQGSYLYRNDSPSAAKNTFLGLHLMLPLETASADAAVVRAGHPAADSKLRPAIGAAVTLIMPDGSKRIAQVDGGAGHSGKRSPDLHFGLGNVPLGTELKVQVRWRDGAGQVRSTELMVKPGWSTVELGVQS